MKSFEKYWIIRYAIGRIPGVCVSRRKEVQRIQRCRRYLKLGIII